MKKYLLFLIIISFISITTNAQIFLNFQGKLKEKVVLFDSDLKQRHKFEPGQRLILDNIQLGTYDGQTYYVFNVEGNTLYLKGKDIEKVEFDKPIDVFDSWRLNALKTGLYEHLAIRGMEYDLRAELDKYSIDFINSLSENNLVFEDDYITDYVQSLLYKIHPGPLRDQRPGNLKIMIMKNNIPNAFSLPNGTIIITTGMISLITCEDELLGVLAHETAHFVLDHHVINISTRIEEEEKAQRRADFWAGFATVLAAASEVYLSVEHDVYLGGSLTYATSMISYSIASEIAESVGMNYNHQQEQDADEAAYAILEYIDADPVAYASVLKKLKSYNTETGNTIGNMASYSHPDIDTRIKYMEADINNYFEQEYQVKISFINTYNAKYEFYSQHYSECEALVDRNLNAGIATETDYLIKAMITRIRYNTPAKNREALNYLHKAKSINIEPNISLSKQEGITYLRLNEKQNAIQAFLEYKSRLEERLDNLNEKNRGGIWEKIYWDAFEELSWVKRMLYKIDKI